MKRFKLSIRITAVFLAATLVFSACRPEGTHYGEMVVIHELADPDMLNPYNYQSAGAGYIMNHIFQSLLATEHHTLDIVPLIAKSRPKMEQITDSILHITFEIRPEARWDNGDPITAKDVEFSLKVIKNPRVNNQRLRPSYEFIDSIKFYNDNPNKFTLICNQVYMLAESASGGFSILPPHVYDPEGLMDDFTVHQLNNNADELRNDPKIIEFANQFNSEKHQRERGYVEGSGAYRFAGWETGRRVTLERKEDWWGDQFEEEHMYFQAYAPVLRYDIINDQTTALVSLRGQGLDVMSGIAPRDFSRLPDSRRFTENYHAYSPQSMAYSYLGINMRNPKFEDIRVRRALAHLVDVERIIDNVFYGYGEQVTGPTHPSIPAYNDTITPYEFNIEKARRLLAEAGWEDLTGNGFLDKEIDGQIVPFDIEFTFNSGNEQRRAIGLHFQENARRAGIRVTPIAQEWSVFLENNRNHNFEIFVGAWIGTPIASDPKQIWHTESVRGGSNYVGFGDERTDRLIDRIRTELDEDKRNEMFKELQWLIFKEVPYIFLHAPLERMAIHKRFDNAEPSELRPGYYEAGFIYRGEEAVAVD